MQLANQSCNIVNAINYDTWPWKVLLMIKIIEIKTERLLLRQWKKEDRELFAELNSDHRVMEYFPKTLNRTESNKMAKHLKSLIVKQGWGFWAVELLDNNEFIGFVGLNKPTDDLPFSPCVEIGWRLLEKYWGKGYATEAAQGALEFGFTKLGLTEIVSFTSVLNTKSIKVMKKLNMSKSEEYFNHPMIPKGSPLSKHCLYKVSLTEWKQTSLPKPPKSRDSDN